MSCRPKASSQALPHLCPENRMTLSHSMMLFAVLLIRKHVLVANSIKHKTVYVGLE